MKTSKDARCVFDPKWNSFQMIDSRKRLRSWSKIIKQYTEEVDSNELAEKYVAKHGGIVADVLKQWGDKAKTSLERGIKVHGIFDEYIQDKTIKVYAGTGATLVALKFINDFFVSGRLTPVASEIIAYNEQHNCATLIDCIVKDKAENHYIIDWKTDEVIKNNSYGKRMKIPFNILPDHPLQKHKLQLNFCKSLCTDYKIAGMFIGHIGLENYKLIPVEDMNLNLAAFTPADKPLPF